MPAQPNDVTEEPADLDVEVVETVPPPRQGASYRRRVAVGVVAGVSVVAAGYAVGCLARRWAA